MALNNQRKQEFEQEEGPWSQLPPELLLQIYSHLFKRDVGAFAIISSVCKSWDLKVIKYRGMIITASLPDPRSLNVLSPEYPCLMTLNGSVCRFFHPNHTFSMDFPELSSSYIMFCKFGWLLLRRFYPNENDCHSYFFFSPYTRQKIELPDWPRGYEYEFKSACFSAPPTCSECYVIGMACNMFGLIKHGEQQWKFYGTLKVDIYATYSHLVLCKDHCYAVGLENKIVVFDLKKKRPKILRERPSYNGAAKFLLEDRGELLSVIVSNEEDNIVVRRMSRSKQVWVDVSALRNKMLIVSRTASFTKPAPVKGASNKVYFPKILNENGFVPYCLATRKYVSFDGDYCSGSPISFNVDYSGSSGNDRPLKVREWTNCTWIDTMPFVSTCNQEIDWFY